MNKDLEMGRYWRIIQACLLLWCVQCRKQTGILGFEDREGATGKAYRQPQKKLKKIKEMDSPFTSSKEPALPTPWVELFKTHFKTTHLQNCKRIPLCCFKPLNLLPVIVAIGNQYSPYLRSFYKRKRRADCMEQRKRKRKINRCYYTPQLFKQKMCFCKLQFSYWKIMLAYIYRKLRGT